MGAFVARLAYSGHPGGEFRHEEIEGPSWEQVAEKIRELDQENVYSISLPNDEETVVMIISGGKGLYHVGCIIEEVDHFYLSNGSPPSGKMTLLNEAGGGDSFPAHQISNDMRAVLRAARTFFETGERDAALQWVDEAGNVV